MLVCKMTSRDASIISRNWSSRIYSRSLYSITYHNISLLYLQCDDACAFGERPRGRLSGV